MVGHHALLGILDPSTTVAVMYFAQFVRPIDASNFVPVGITIPVASGLVVENMVESLEKIRREEEEKKNGKSV